MTAPNRSGYEPIQPNRKETTPAARHPKKRKNTGKPAATMRQTTKNNTSELNALACQSHIDRKYRCKLNAYNSPYHMQLKFT
ncbi:hypothetical protein Pla8534_42900 [Lignipirellula cremea]|uniref:Uncharacterized protein n=1 Tax=Lignipirellula cremea TaxID=2528010 RepID=A0A518DXA8_9BACT|nr:hypothetical protein Pla8534_42900 [Lignipirellula cremea]